MSGVRCGTSVAWKCACLAIASAQGGLGMTGNIENLILEHPRSGGQDRVESELREVATRPISLEASTAAGRRDSVRNY